MKDIDEISNIKISPPHFVEDLSLQVDQGIFEEYLKLKRGLEFSLKNNKTIKQQDEECIKVEPIKDYLQFNF